MSAASRAERLQTRADAAAASALEAYKCCSERRERTEQLKLRMQSNTAAAALEKGCAIDSPSEKAQHQFDAFHSCEQQEQDLLKQLNAIQRCRGTRSCNCLACWEEKARARKEVADTLSCVASKAWECVSTESRGGSLALGSMDRTMAGAAGAALRLPETRQVTPPATAAPDFRWSAGEQRSTVPATRAQSASAVLRRVQGYPTQAEGDQKRRGSNASVCSSASDASTSSAKSAPAALPSLALSPTPAPALLSAGSACAWRASGAARTMSRAGRTRKRSSNEDF